MEKDDFKRILTGAVAGREKDTEKILELYMPLIDKLSYVEGRLDEDLKQCLMLHIIMNIGKFSL